MLYTSATRAVERRLETWVQGCCSLWEIKSVSVNPTLVIVGVPAVRPPLNIYVIDYVYVIKVYGSNTALRSQAQNCIMGLYVICIVPIRNMAPKVVYGPILYLCMIPIS